MTVNNSIENPLTTQQSALDATNETQRAVLKLNHKLDFELRVGRIGILMWVKKQCGES
jgi:hypothetical protein